MKGNYLPISNNFSKDLKELICNINIFKVKINQNNKNSYKNIY